MTEAERKHLLQITKEAAAMARSLWLADNNHLSDLCGKLEEFMEAFQPMLRREGNKDEEDNDQASSHR